MAVVVTTNKIKLHYIWTDCILYLNMNAYKYEYIDHSLFSYMHTQNAKTERRTNI